MRLAPIVFLVALFGTGVPSYANECMRLWAERNTIFYNQGYCFGSNLGQQYFGNAGCTTKNPKLTSGQKSVVATIKKREKALRCAAQKSRWSASQIRASVRGNLGGSAPKPAPSQPSCTTSAELYFNVPGRMEIQRGLDVQGPWYTSIWSSSPQAFITSHSGKCVGGSYSYRYRAEFDDLGTNPVREYTGTISLTDYTRRCEVSINERGGGIQLFCN